MEADRLNRPGVLDADLEDFMALAKNQSDSVCITNSMGIIL